MTSEIRTDNDFMIALDGGKAVQPILPIRIITRQQAYRAAAWIALMGDMLPDERLASSYPEVQKAIANT